jgi:hypothetical protein
LEEQALLFRVTPLLNKQGVDILEGLSDVLDLWGLSLCNKEIILDNGVSKLSNGETNQRLIVWSKVPYKKDGVRSP